MLVLFCEHVADQTHCFQVKGLSSCYKLPVDLASGEAVFTLCQCVGVNALVVIFHQ